MYWSGLIFDLDGTLADTLPVSYAAFRRTIREAAGSTWTNGEIHSRFGPSEEGVLSTLLGESSARAYELFLEFYRREHRRCPSPVLGMRELLGELTGSGVRCAIVTGKGAEAAAITLDRIGLTGVFETIEAGSARGAVKVECMRRIVEAWGLPRDRVASIGDFPSDVRAARAAGIRAVGAAWASTANRAALVDAGADPVFERVSDLARWLRQDC